MKIENRFRVRDSFIPQIILKHQIFINIAHKIAYHGRRHPKGLLAAIGMPPREKYIFWTQPADLIVVS